MNDELEKKLNEWWWTTNGTGIGTCLSPLCRNGESVCSWHSARLEDLAEIFESQRNELLNEVEAKLPKEKEGINVYNQGTEDEFYTCTECGGYEECDCEGFNTALEETHKVIQSMRSK